MGGFRREGWRLQCGQVDPSRRVGCVSSFRLPADAGGDRLLGGGVLLPDALRRGLDAVRGLECFDLFGQLGNAWPFPSAWLWAVAESPALSWSRKPVNSERYRSWTNGLPSRA